jgi:hypothetical protein
MSRSQVCKVVGATSLDAVDAVDGGVQQHFWEHGW